MVDLTDQNKAADISPVIDNDRAADADRIDPRRNLQIVLHHGFPRGKALIELLKMRLLRKVLHV